MNETAPESPCIRVCTLDDDGVCLGCERTIEEIVRWSSLSAAARREIIARLPERRQRRDAPPS